jgi:type I restriction enzyme S subunit
VISRNSVGRAYPLKRLDEVVEFLDSKRRPVTESDRRAGPYPYFGANGQQGTIDDYIFDEPLVLLAEDGGHFGEPERGIAYRIYGKTWVNNHAHVLRPKSNIDLGYLCRVLEHYDVTPFVTGTTRGKLTQAGTSEIPIPLPPLAGQRQIAKILDRAEALRAKRRATLAQLDTLTQAIFLDLFGDPLTNHKEFPIYRMGDVCDVRDGTHDSPKYVSEGGYPLVTSKNLTGGIVDLTDVNFISETDYAQINKRSKVDRGDIIMPMIGTIGSPVLVDHKPHYAIKNVALIKFIATSPSAVYIRHLLSCHYFDHIVLQKNRGGTQKFVSLGDLRSFPIPLPPDELQREFARRVAAVEKLKTTHRTSLTEMDTLFTSLQHRAFRGEL